MTGAGETLVGLAMIAGLVGVLVPVLPGLLLIWAAGLVWTIGDGGGPVRWVVFGVLTALLVVGTVAKYVLPARSTAARGAPRTTLLAGAAGAVAGFFLIPVVGVLVGGVAGSERGELRRLRDGRRAAASTRVALVAIGIGVLVELAAGALMVGAWLLGLLVT